MAWSGPVRPGWVGMGRPWQVGVWKGTASVVVWIGVIRSGRLRQGRTGTALDRQAQVILGTVGLGEARTGLVFIETTPIRSRLLCRPQSARLKAKAMVRLTALEYWHSFRPPHQTSLFVNPSEVASIRELPFDERRCEKLCEVVMQNGSKFLVEGRADDVSSRLQGIESTD